MSYWGKTARTACSEENHFNYNDTDRLQDTYKHAPKEYWYGDINIRQGRLKQEVLRERKEILWWYNGSNQRGYIGI